jgi:uncharacterized membrane protein
VVNSGSRIAFVSGCSSSIMTQPASGDERFWSFIVGKGLDLLPGARDDISGESA